MPGCGGGGGGGGSTSSTTTTPTTSASVFVTSPASGEQVTDLDFLTTSADETFEITLAYSGSSAMAISTLSVALQMDSGAEQDITDYFSKVSETSIKSSGLNQFTNTLFNFTENDQVRTMTVKVSIRDQSSNTATTTSTFQVVPVGDLPPMS